MTNEQIDALATYFTGPAVVHNSIQLGMGKGYAKIARQYFDARSALGIGGYDSKDEALQKLQWMKDPVNG